MKALKDYPLLDLPSHIVCPKALHEAC